MCLRVCLMVIVGRCDVAEVLSLGGNDDSCMSAPMLLVQDCSANADLEIESSPPPPAVVLTSRLLDVHCV